MWNNNTLSWFGHFCFIGLLKERPILDHHAKAHIHEIWWISPEIHPKPYKIRCFNKNSSVWGVHGGGYDPRFHEIWGHNPSPAFIKLNSFDWNICFYKVLGGFHVKLKDHLQGIVTLCLISSLDECSDDIVIYTSEIYLNYVNYKKYK